MTRLRWFALSLAALVLSGCLETVGPRGASARSAGLLPGGSARQAPRPLEQAALARGTVVVAGPEGYCVDPVTLGRGAARSFAMLASCQILSGGELGYYVEPMMLTVTVGKPGPTALPQPATLAAEAGSAFLGGSLRDGVSVAHLGAGGAAVLDGGDPRYWRATFALGGRMVGLALYAPKGSDLAGDGGYAMLARVRARIVAARPKPGQTTARASSAAKAPGAAAAKAL